MANSTTTRVESFDETIFRFVRKNATPGTMSATITPPKGSLVKGDTLKGALLRLPESITDDGYAAASMGGIEMSGKKAGKGYTGALLTGAAARSVTLAVLRADADSLGEAVADKPADPLTERGVNVEPAANGKPVKAGAK